MKEITKAQEDILKVIWEINEGAVSDVLAKIPEPKPAYNTVATVIKVLENKGYISHKTFGKTNVYYPIIEKKEYTKFVFKDYFKSLFNGSLNQAVSFFVQEKKDVSLQELEEIKNIIESEIKKQSL
jgi:BlaI family transcriptional regulator, penicillinase repressor